MGEPVASHQATVPLTVNAVSADEAAAATADPDVTDEVVVLTAARATGEARQLADGGDDEAAARVLREAATELRAVAPRSDRSASLMRQADILEHTVGELHANVYGPASSKRLHYGANELKRNRRPRSGA